jgi:hypothetical protein
MTDPARAESVDGLVGAGEAARAAGVTYRQLDYWTRTGSFTPTVAVTGSGRHRRFSREDVVVLRGLGRVSVSLGGGPSGGLLAEAERQIRSHVQAGRTTPVELELAITDYSYLVVEVSL